MRTDARDRLAFQEDLADTRRDSRTVAVLIPVLTECPSPGCGFDELHDGAIDPSCSACSGLGRTATWAISRMFGNVRNVDQGLITYGAIPPGAQIGDTLLSIRRRDYQVLKNALNEKDAYINVDGERFRPVEISVAGLGRIEEYLATLRSYAPIYTATGY